MMLLNTERLMMEPLQPADANFILELVNTDGWLKFIGNRNVNSEADALAYIQKILNNKAVKYWVVRLRENQLPVGVITFIQREYLDHPDIGFAFLPQYTGRGYAYEAAKAILDSVIQSNTHSSILATTIPGNKNSIQLLHKLGLQFEKEIKVEEELLHVYAVLADKLAINELVRRFFTIFNNTDGRQPDWNLLYEVCIPEAIIIKKEDAHTVYDLTSFITPRQKILTDGSLIDFEEHETGEQTTISSNIAQRYCGYEKSGTLRGNYFKQKGHKLFQFIKTTQGWKISSMVWEDEKG